MQLRLIVTVFVFLVAVFAAPAFCEESAGEKDPFALLTAERIGTLHSGMTEAEVKKVVSCKPKKGKEILEHATGDYVAEWKYPECGITLKMASERKGGAENRQLDHHRKSLYSQNATWNSDREHGRGGH
ncbi:MAG: hypothetical protein AB9866_11705 [Syntrophobacteraceae bacterium]